MAEAIVKGLLHKRLTTPGQIGMFNRSNAERLEQLRNQYGVYTALEQSDKEKMLQSADIIFLAIKPKDAAESLRTLAPLLNGRQMIVSLIAGLPIRTIERLLGQTVPVIRTMPNTSATVGLGATGLSFSDAVSAHQRDLAEELFRAVGMTAVVEEPQLDAVTAVSGSGPAYIYYMMETMMAAGQKLGLSPQAARELTLQTVLGAAHMVIETGEEPAELRRKVTSPNGTTQAAIETLESHRFSEAFMHAMERCMNRARELGAEIERSAGE
ncbi:pyrroline-5-carboxylate reductase [Paenibacillus beijingensis]|uniref:Pyrroline-5-carboxylate reductase n=2 Tax=Paenibacillus beijingensis TaxID=1126833 RepID=A0A0D5NS62_9BACL|nr:pyrroline-5-carboxylate reductase [Paenibacillus beijingensis]